MSKEDALEAQVAAQVAAEEETAKIQGRPSIFARAGLREVIGFIRQLGILARGQHTLAAALKVLARSVTNKDLAKTIQNLSDQVEEGVTLSAAMSDYPWYFNEVTTGIVEAAQESGSLADALEQIAADMEDDQAFRTQVVDALLYPAVLMVGSLGMIAGLMLFIVPRFSEYITATGGKIEGVAATLLGISEFLRSWYGVPLIILVLLGMYLVMHRIRVTQPLLYERVVGRIPIVGSVFMRAALRRFTGTLNLLLQHNVSLPHALSLCQKVVSHRYVAAMIGELRDNVDQGKEMATVLHEKNRLNPVVVDMICVGEESGQLTEMLTHLVNHIRQDFERFTSRLSVLLQPVVLVLLGALFLVVFLAFFLPYFDVLTNLASQR